MYIVLKRVVDYYTHHGSSYFCAFIDFYKAFDSVNYQLLFCKLIDNNNILQLTNTAVLYDRKINSLVLQLSYLSVGSMLFLISS